MVNEQLLSEILEDGSLEEKQIINSALKAIERKRNRKSSYMSGFLNFTSEFIDEDTFQLNIPITPFMLNSLGIVHGGVTATIIDTTMGTVIRKKFLPKGHTVVTTEMKINYIKPGKGNKLISKAIILHKGRTQCVTECKVYNEEGTLVAAATGTFIIVESKFE